MESLLPGATVGRFSILERIGAGGQAAVYAAHDPELDRKVALKLLHSRTSSRRLLREAQAMAKVSHPNVIVVFDVGTFGDEVFLAEELVDGKTVAEWMRERRPWREVVAVFIEAGRGLAAAHAAGLIHRDFKPANVLIGSDRRVRVTDFGLARAAEERPDATPLPRKAATAVDVSPHDETVDARSDSGSPPQMLGTMTEAGALVGTPLYASPEQHAGDRTDARTDQWSFCASLWEALYGATPFTGATIDELAKAKAGRPSAPEGSDVPDWLRRMLVRGLSVDRDKRFPTMDALLAALERDPAVTRRRRALAAALVALPLAAGAVALVVSSRGASTRVCGGGETELAGVWDDARRKEITTAFSAAGTPLAAPSAAAVSTTLDRWRVEYTRMHRDACEATHVRKTQKPELLDRRMACLAERRHQVRALVDLFAKADAKLVERSIEAAMHVADVSPCGDTVALSTPMQPPPAANAPAIAAAREKLARAKALEEAGQYPAGVALAKEVVTEARKLGYRPLVAEALGQAGALEGDAGNYPGAEEHLSEALRVADAIGYDELRARAAVDLVDIVGFRRSRFDEAHQLARQAEAILTRFEGNEALRARLDMYEGGVFRAERKLDESMAKQKSAIARLEKLYGAESADVARARLNMANSLAQKGDLETALAEFQHALKVFTKTFGDRHPAVALCHNNIGNIHLIAGRPADAIGEYRIAREVWEAVLGPEHADVAMARGNLALSLHGTGKLEEAKTEFLATIAIYEKVLGKDAPDVAVYMTNLAMLYNDMERYADAVTALEGALAIAEKQLGAEHPDVAFTRTELAFALGHAGRGADAVKQAERALAVRLSQQQNVSPAEIGRSEFAVGFALWKAKDRPRALAMMKAARERLSKAGEAGAHEIKAMDEWYAKDVAKK